MNLITTYLQIGGVAAVVAAIVAAGVTYLAKSTIDRKLQQMLETQQEYIKALVEKQQEYFPDLASAIYRSRNAARELLAGIPDQKPDQRAIIGDLGLRISEALFTARVFLPSPLFKSLHSYKRSLQSFINEYDEITSGIERPALISGLKKNYEQMDELHEKITKDLQEILRVK